jgi:hypothetical protein
MVLDLPSKVYGYPAAQEMLSFMESKCQSSSSNRLREASYIQLSFSPSVYQRFILILSWHLWADPSRDIFP